MKHTPPALTKRSPVIAAIDLGTNSCRLLIARVYGSSFRIIDSFSKVVRLGEGVHSSENLNPEAMERTLEALKICQHKINHHEAFMVRAVTTEACRRAQNSLVFLERVRHETGINFEMISSAEEARLALMGCAGILNSRVPYALAFDIGGGSTEVMWLKINQPRRIHRRRTPIIDVIDYTSLPYGVVTLSEAHADRITQAYHDIRESTAKELTSFSARNNILDFLKTDKVQMIGTSGTITTLAAIHLDLKRYDRRVVDGAFMSLTHIHTISEKISKMSPAERNAHPCIGPGRSDLVMMGTAILQGICDTWPLSQLRVADRGVREGILMDLVQIIQGRKGPRQKIRT